ncbi:putative Permease [Candidatus Sulfopaludibacter sp. SbA3]|nr:putative Permease [Candidatus Sulfopaludibacter sp. SbA3]
MELWRKLVFLFKGRHSENDLEQEMRFHLEMKADANRAAGMSDREARHDASQRFGNATLLQEVSRDAWGWAWLERLGDDIRLSFRMLRKNPGFAAVAVLTLALGIGANTTAFCFVNAILLKKLQVERPEDLVKIGNYGYNYAILREFGQHTDVLAGVAGYGGLQINLTSGTSSARVGGDLVSGSYFDVLGVHPAIGRTLSAEDDGAEGAHPVCVISWHLWQGTFNGDPEILSRTVELNAHPFQIVGVLQPGFRGTHMHSPHDVMVPMSMTEMFYGAKRDDPHWAWLAVMGGLKAGVPLPRAEAAISGFLLNLKIAFAGRNPVYKLIPAEHGTDNIQETLGDPAKILMGTVGLVLLIACANLAGLLLARGSSRHREFAVRLSLGATRANLIRQILTESAVLAVLGVVFSFAVSAWLTRLLLHFFHDPQSNVTLAVTMDPAVLAFTVALAVGTAVTFGLLPAWYATRVQVNAGLKNQLARAGRSGGRLRQGLLVFEIALGLTLLFGAGVLTRSMRNLQTIELGFNPDQVVTLALQPGQSGYTKTAAQEFFARLLDQSRKISGVRAAALSSVGVLTGGMWAGGVKVPGYVPHGPDVNNNFNNVSPDYFRTLRIPLLAGRDFTEADRQGAPDVLIVNQQFVTHYWPGQNALGRKIRANGRDGEIVGVVKTAKYQRLKEDPQITIYFPLAQRWSGALTLDVRTSANSGRMIARLETLVRGLDPKLTVNAATTLVEQRDAGISRERLLAFLSTFMGCLAAALVAIGLYGLIAYAVVRRTGEIGIRLALGAQPGNIRWLFVREGLWIAILGLALGAPLAYIGSRVLKTLVFGVSPQDPLAMIAGVVVLVLVAAASALLPSWRGSRLDPMRALRYE